MRPQDPHGEKQFIYMGCCVQLPEQLLGEMIDGNEWTVSNPDINELHFREMQEHCVDLDIWAKVMGYVTESKDGLRIENDWSLSYGKGKWNGFDCYWIDHSRIEYVWVHTDNRPKAMIAFDTETHSLKGPVLPSDMTPAERAKLRAAAKIISGTVKCNKCGDESNSAPGLQCGRALGTTKDGDESLPPHCNGVYQYEGVPFEHYERQEAAAVAACKAAGIPFGDHGVFIDASGTQTGRLSSTKPTLQYIPIPGTPQEKAERREKVKKMFRVYANEPMNIDYASLERAIWQSFTPEQQAEYLKQFGEGIDMSKLAENLSVDELKDIARSIFGGNDPEAMKIIPYAISMDSMEKWGCPSCGYHQGKIPFTAPGAFLWTCLSCAKTCHVLVPGLETSSIGFGGGEADGIEFKTIYPKLSEHPRRGQIKRTEK